MRLPQELVEHIIDCLSDDHQMLATCSLVAKAWLVRSRRHLFSEITLDRETIRKWCSLIRPGPNGVSFLVHTLALLQAPGFRWLDTGSLDAFSDHFSSFRHVENLSVTWLDLSCFEPASLTRHFFHYGPSLRTLRVSYLSADYSALNTFLQLFPNLENILIHAPDLCDDNPPLRISTSAPIIHGFLDLLSFDSASSPFISHLAGLDLRFSSISAFHCTFPSGLPLTTLLDASASSLRHLQLEYIKFSGRVGVSLIRCENLQDVTVGPFKEEQSPLLLFSLLSTLSSLRLTHLIIDFAPIPDHHWPEWKAIDTHLFHMAKRCGLRRGPQVRLRTRLEVVGDVPDGRQLLPKYSEIGPVEVHPQP